MARPSVVVTESQRRQVKSMVALGLRQEEIATSGKNTAATIFWVKTRCGLRERARGEQEFGQEVPPLVVRLD